MLRDFRQILVLFAGAGATMGACHGGDFPPSSDIIGCSSCDFSCASCSTSCSTTTSCGTTTSCSTTSCGACVASCAQVCTDGETATCYQAPADTLVGSCAQGVTTCTPAGAFDMKCAGQVIPHADACDLATTWTCDGAEPACGAPVWAAALAGTGNEHASSIALDAAGNIAIAGLTDAGTLTVGGDAVSTAATGAFVAKLDADGNPLWGAGIGGAQTIGVAVDALGDVFVAGSFTNELTVRDRTFQTGTKPTAFLAEFSPGGALVWARPYHVHGAITVGALGITTAGDLVVVGSYEGVAVTLGPAALQATLGVDALVASFDPASGEPIWAFPAISAPGDEMLTALAVDASGQMAAAGSVAPEGCLSKPVVIGIDPGGFLTWSSTFLFHGEARAIVAEGQGAFLVTGSSHGVVPATDLSVSALGFVGRVDSGGLSWLRGLGSWSGHAIGVDANGSMVIGGAAPAIGAHPPAAHLHKLDPRGLRFYSHTFEPVPESGGQDPLASIDALAVAPDLHLVVAGSLRGVVDFGLGFSSKSAASTARIDPFVAALGP